MTTYQAAVHGFNSAASGKLKKLRRAVAERFPAPSVPQRERLKQRSVFWNRQLGRWAVKFPGSDSAVIRASQRLLPTHLCPSANVFFLVESKLWLTLTMVAGFIFSTLASRSWGRRLLLAFPGFFSLGVFTEKGPSQDQLEKSSFTTTVLARPSVSNSQVRVDISGPEPGYVATPLLYLAMASTLLEHYDDLPHKAGCVMPASMVGDSAALDGLVSRIKDAGLAIQVTDQPAPPYLRESP